VKGWVLCWQGKVKKYTGVILRNAVGKKKGSERVGHPADDGKNDNRATQGFHHLQRGKRSHGGIKGGGKKDDPRVKENHERLGTP